MNRDAKRTASPLTPGPLPVKGRGRTLGRFMATTRVKILEVFPLHEPRLAQSPLVWSNGSFPLTPPSPQGRGGRPGGRFMASTRIKFLEVFATHEPERQTNRRTPKPL